MKECTRCHQQKDFSQFRIRPDRGEKTGKVFYYSRCIACANEVLKERKREKSKDRPKSNPGPKPLGIWKEEGRECKECGKYNDWSGFRKYPNKTGYYPVCKECQGKKKSEKYHALPAEEKKALTLKSKNYRLLRQYKFTIADLERMIAERDSKCDICGKQTELFHIDHCHQTNVFRGLLCNGCNTGLGLFKENEQVFIRAIEYLKAHAKNRDPNNGSNCNR